MLRRASPARSCAVGFRRHERKRPRRAVLVAATDAPSGDSSPGSRDWAKYRKAKPAEHLLPPSSKKLLDQLPRGGPISRDWRQTSTQVAGMRLAHHRDFRPRLAAGVAHHVGTANEGIGRA